MDWAGDAICAQFPDNAELGPLPGFPHLPARFAPLVLALACLPALHGREARLPELPQGLDETERDAFLHALDMSMEGTRLVPPAAAVHRNATPWTAPSPAWAIAYALTAFARPHLKLANPGIMTALYPRFWALYNALPEAHASQAIHQSEERRDEPKRKRVRLTGVYTGTGGTDGAAGD